MSSCRCVSESALHLGTQGSGGVFGRGVSPPSSQAFRLLSLRLTNFRNHDCLLLDPEGCSVVLIGENGAGKTNILEAISLLGPGYGLRGSHLETLARDNGPGNWSSWARVAGPTGTHGIGSGFSSGGHAARRMARIDGNPLSSLNRLTHFLHMIWITPAMDSLFTGGGSERRRFLDHLVLSVDAEHGRRVNGFKRAMRQRNTLLSRGSHDSSWLKAIETQMSEYGVAIAAARREMAETLRATSAFFGPPSPFPAAQPYIKGPLEEKLADTPAIDVEEQYRKILVSNRRADAQVGRTLIGPHRSDLIVYHAAKKREARLCSSGEQKALLTSLILTHCRATSLEEGKATPVILFDEAAAHLDGQHRAALFKELSSLGAQTWMTGTDARLFATAEASIYRIGPGKARSLA